MFSRRVGQALVLTGLVACELPVRPVATSPDQPIELDGTSIVIDRQRPYPIHARWWICEDASDCPGTRTEVTPAAFPDSVADGFALAMPVLANLLSPTPAVPFIIPKSPRDGSIYYWRCNRGFDNHLRTGDTIPPGLTLHIVYMPNDHDARYTAAAAPCGWDRFSGQHPLSEADKSVMGVVMVPPLRGTRPHTVNRWRRIALHEVGHILGVGWFHHTQRWGDSYVTSADSTMHWLTDSTIVGTFDRAGGTAYPGRKVPVADRYHWHPCASKGDVMASADGHRFTALSVAAFYPGFVTELRGGFDEDASDRWTSCPELAADGHGIADIQGDMVGDVLIPEPTVHVPTATKGAHREGAPE